MLLLRCRVLEREMPEQIKETGESGSPVRLDTLEGNNSGEDKNSCVMSTPVHHLSPCEVNALQDHLQPHLRPCRHSLDCTARVSSLRCKTA